MTQAQRRTRPKNAGQFPVMAALDFEGDAMEAIRAAETSGERQALGLVAKMARKCARLETNVAALRVEVRGIVGARRTQKSRYDSNGALIMLEEARECGGG